MTNLRIIAAAIRLECGVIATLPPPHRHPDLMTELYAELKEFFNYEQGFLDSTGAFLTREEAYKVAKEASQILPRDYLESIGVTHTPGVLYTEDLF